MDFYLGTHMTNWLNELDIPLMVSHRRLAKRRTLPRALAPWVLDSGGFTELHLHGGWQLPPAKYARTVERYADQIGRMVWAAPQDWMCEPSALKATGLTIAEHQRRTIINYLELAGLGPFIPVLQGWTRDDYHRHVDAYTAAGINLTQEATVGLGTVCRRQHTPTILALADELTHQGIRLHGFGVKRKALNSAAAHLFTSMDSMAWSYRARRAQPLEGCTHQSCSSCPRFALQWQAETIRRLGLTTTYQRELAL